jgi:hypothetical protein
MKRTVLLLAFLWLFLWAFSFWKIGRFLLLCCKNLTNKRKWQEFSSQCGKNKLILLRERKLGRERTHVTENRKKNERKKEHTIIVYIGFHHSSLIAPSKWKWKWVSEKKLVVGLGPRILQVVVLSRLTELLATRTNENERKRTKKNPGNNLFLALSSNTLPTKHIQMCVLFFQSSKQTFWHVTT